MKHFTARSKPRGCFDPSLANHIDTPNKPRPKAKRKPTPAQKQRQRVAELRAIRICGNMLIFLHGFRYATKKLWTLDGQDSREHNYVSTPAV